MQVILLDDVEKLGLRGDVVDVARGYARNFLLPRRMAEVATPARLADLERRDAQRARQEAKTVDEAREKLSARGLFVVKMESASGESAPPLLSRQIFARKKLNGRQLTVFTRQLSTLVQVSPLEEALRTIARQTEKDQVRDVLMSVHGSVLEGAAGGAMAPSGEIPAALPRKVRGQRRVGDLARISERLAV